MCRCVCVSARSSLCVLTLRILYPSRFRPPAVMCLICVFLLLFCLFVVVFVFLQRFSSCVFLISSWYALLLLFFFRFSSLSLHCSAIQFSLAFLMHPLMLLFTSLYFLDPSGSKLFVFSSLLLSHRLRISAVIQGFSSDDVCQGSHWMFQSLQC